MPCDSVLEYDRLSARFHDHWLHFKLELNWRSAHDISACDQARGEAVQAKRCVASGDSSSNLLAADGLCRANGYLLQATQEEEDDCRAE